MSEYIEKLVRDDELREVNPLNESDIPVVLGLQVLNEDPGSLLAVKVGNALKAALDL